MTIRKNLITAGAAGALLLAPALVQAETVRVGFMTTLTGGGSIIGKTQKDAFELGLEHVNGKIGGLDTAVFIEDTQRKPDVAKQLANRMIKKDRVQFVTGIIWSNLLGAVYKSVTRSDAFLISANAGSSVPAGEQCSENFFSVSFQNDQVPEAMGKYMQGKGIDNVYLMAPNYQAGKDMLVGFNRRFSGNVVGQVFTKLGQKDYQAEISQLRAANPDALFIFLPGGMGINFVKQYAQAGLKIPLYSAYTVDAISAPILKEAALGTLGAQHWSPDLDNPTNKKFVSSFRAKYGYTPAFYAAQAYDLVLFLDAAVKAAGGVDDKDKLRAAMRKYDFPNTRGKMALNNNHLPIQNFYLRETVQDSELGYTTKVTDTIYENYGDAYAEKCKMSW